jgi:hypothetical protein
MLHSTGEATREARLGAVRLDDTEMKIHVRPRGNTERAQGWGPEVVAEEFSAGFSGLSGDSVYLCLVTLSRLCLAAVTACLTHGTHARPRGRAGADLRLGNLQGGVGSSLKANR